MTSSRVDHPPALARSVNRQTRPVKGMKECKERLATEWRRNRKGECIEGKVCTLWIVRGDADASNATKVVEDAAQAVIFGRVVPGGRRGEGRYTGDEDVVDHHVHRATNPGPHVELQVFSWPAERRQYLAAIEAATMDWDEDSRAQHAQRGVQR